MYSLDVFVKPETLSQNANCKSYRGCTTWGLWNLLFTLKAVVEPTALHLLYIHYAVKHFVHK